MMPTMMINKRTQGFSILELLVSAAVGLILIAGISSVYVASKRSYVEVERMSRITQNSRFAIQMITETLQHAGFTGEVPLGNIIADGSLNNPGNDCTGVAAAYNVEYYLFAATTDNNGDAFGCITDAVANTSAIVVKNVRPMRMTDTDDDGIIDNPAALTGTATYIVSNNSQGLLFDGADTAPTVNDSGEVPNGSAWEYEVQIFYIRDTGADPTLSRRTLTWDGAAMSFVTEELIAGVEAMSFLFGLDTNADGEIDTYRTIANMLGTEWAQVAAIETDVLVRSETEDPNHTDNEVYNLGGIAAIGPLADNYHRMVMQSTVSLRNPKFVIRGNL